MAKVAEDGRRCRKVPAGQDRTAQDRTAQDRTDRLERGQNR